jgi:hypothetical protein
MHTRSAVSVLSASLLVLALSGCGDDKEAAATSAGTSESGSTAAASPEDAGADDGASEAFLDRLKAGMGEEGSVHVEMTMTGPMETSAEGDTVYGPDGSEMQLSMKMANLPGGAMEMVLVDGKAYMSMPGVTPPGKFFAVDEDDPAFGSLDDGLSPTDSFDAFEAGLEQVDELGTEDVDGESTTHYRLDVDAKSALEATGQSAVPGLPETLTYDVWLDADDRMRRITYELAGTELTMDMTEWGEPVTITAPDAADLVDPPRIAG